MENRESAGETSVGAGRSELVSRGPDEIGGAVGLSPDFIQATELGCKEAALGMFRGHLIWLRDLDSTVPAERASARPRRGEGRRTE